MPRLARFRHAAMILLVAGAFAAHQPRAELLRFEILDSERPALEGRVFGSVGKIEKITGKATIAVDPADPHDAVIVDIGLAPRDIAGRVEAVSDVVILRPVSGGNETLLLEVPNRGGKLIGSLFDEVGNTAGNRLEYAGDGGSGFLLSHGFTLVWVGWQGDLPHTPGLLRLDAPAVPDVSGLSREEFVFDHTRNPATAALTYPAAAVPGDAVLTVRAHPDDQRLRPADLSFSFTDPLHIEIARPAGFDAAAIYELIYTARDPKPMALGFAAIRDVATFLRRQEGGNPLGRPAEHAYAIGVSQSGRVLRDFLYWGFNEDEHGRIVFDALNPHVPGTRRSFVNARFAQPGRNPSSQTDRLYPADQFPFTYSRLDDPVSGRRDGLLLRCRLTNTCPKVMQTDSEAEFFGSRASLLVTDTAGNHIDLPPDVRAYMLAGAPHFSGPGAVTSRKPECALPLNPLDNGAAMRALLLDLDAWVKNGVEPPASRYPMRAHGTLVPFEGLYPQIPGLPYVGLHTPATLVDDKKMPPVATAMYPVFAPRVDNDGIAVAGIRQLAVAVPNATYTGWNPRAEGFGAGALCTNMGAAVPFAESRAARLASGDPRLSVEERYPTPEIYVDAVRAEALRLLAERLLLPDDAASAIAAAKAGTLSRLTGR